MCVYVCVKHFKQDQDLPKQMCVISESYVSNKTQSDSDLYKLDLFYLDEQSA